MNEYVQFLRTLLTQVTSTSEGPVWKSADDVAYCPQYAADEDEVVSQSASQSVSQSVSQ